MAALCAAMGLIGAPAHATTHITLTEEDYFSTSNQVGALTAYNKVFERAHPGVTIKRVAVPFADLDSKLLTQAGSHDLPNILASDNPFVAAMVATGQILPLNKFAGFSTKGYYPAVLDEGLINGKNYSLPVAGENSIALIYNIADFKAANITSPPKTWTQLEADAKLLTTKGGAGSGGVSGFGITCDNCRRHNVAVGALLLGRRRHVHLLGHQWHAWKAGNDAAADAARSGRRRVRRRVQQLLTDPV